MNGSPLQLRMPYKLLEQSVCNNFVVLSSVLLLGPFTARHMFIFFSVQILFSVRILPYCPQADCTAPLQFDMYIPLYHMQGNEFGNAILYWRKYL